MINENWVAANPEFVNESMLLPISESAATIESFLVSLFSSVQRKVYTKLFLFITYFNLVGHRPLPNHI
jgi:hypothetical protein